MRAKRLIKGLPLSFDLTAVMIPACGYAVDVDIIEEVTLNAPFDFYHIDLVESSECRIT